MEGFLLLKYIEGLDYYAPLQHLKSDIYVMKILESSHEAYLGWRKVIL